MKEFGSLGFLFLRAPYHNAPPELDSNNSTLEAST